MTEVAIIEANTLASMGLHEILRGILPEVFIRTFSCFEDMMDDTPDMFKHYFVSADIYLEHTNFFSQPQRMYKTIVLSEGERPMLQGIPHLNVCLPAQLLCRSILIMRKRGHNQTRSMHHIPESYHLEESSTILTRRETEVLRLVIKGCINKEIAEKLNISLTTVITHRKNITEKLNIKAVPELTIYAIIHGIITMDEI